MYLERLTFEYLELSRGGVGRGKLYAAGSPAGALFPTLALRQGSFSAQFDHPFQLISQNLGYPQQTMFAWTREYKS